MQRTVSVLGDINGSLEKSVALTNGSKSQDAGDQLIDNLNKQIDVTKVTAQERLNIKKLFGRHMYRNIERGEKGYGYEDRKSTRLNSSHANISYAVFCLKKKKQ